MTTLNQRKNFPNDQGADVLFDIHLEKSVLAQMIEDPKASFGQLVDLKVDEKNLFYDKANNEVFKALRKLVDDGKEVSVTMLKNQLQKAKKLDEIGGISKIVEILDAYGASLNFKEYVLILLQFSTKRLCLSLAKNMEKKAMDPSTDALDLIDDLREQVSNWEQGIITKNYDSLSNQIKAEAEELEAKQNGTMPGVCIGMPSIDNVTNGLYPGTTTVVAGRPGQGKSALMISWMLAAAKSGKKAIYFSLEMSEKQVRKRILGQLTSLTSNKLKKGAFDEKDWQKFYTETGGLLELPVYLDCTPGVSLREIRTKARHLKFTKGLDIIFIDYLQLMEVVEFEFGFRNRNREQEVAHISRNLKKLAIELEVPVVVGSQLSRAIESRVDNKPKLSDLRESGSIEQDADHVFMLHRPAAYGVTADIEGNDISQLAELHLLKNRDGETGVYNLHFNGPKMAFKEMPENF